MQDEAAPSAAASMARAAAAIHEQLQRLSFSVAPAQSIETETEPAPMRTADDTIFALREGGYATIEIKGPKAKAIRCVWAGRSALRSLCSCRFRLRRGICCFDVEFAGPVSSVVCSLTFP